VANELRLYDLLRRRILVTRESARDLEAPLRSSLDPAFREVRVDFTGVEGVSPSFLDELLRVLDRVASHAGGGAWRFVLAGVPTKMSEKHAAIARGRDLNLTVAADGAWTFESRGVKRPASGS
jgi:hypothetical protein